MKREAAPEFTIVVTGCFSKVSCNSPIILQHCLGRTSETDLARFIAYVNSHFRELNEIREVFAKGGDREGGDHENIGVISTASDVRLGNLRTSRMG